MSISEIAIRRPVLAWMGMSALVIFGGISFTRMGVSQLPDVDAPVVTVSLSLLGAAPEVMETDVVDVVENSLMAIQGVKQISSSSKSGSATVSVEFELSRDIDLAMQDVQTKLAEAQRKLPKEVDPPVVNKTNPDDQPILWLAVESTRMKPKDLMAYVRDKLQGQFSTAPDVGDINLGGYVDPNLRIWVSGKDLDRYQLTVNDVIAAVQNEHSEPPAGWIDFAKKEYNIRTLGEATTVEDFKKIGINTRGGQPNYSTIRLGQVARVEEDLADVRRISRAMGNPAVGLGIRKQRGSNAVAVAQAVKAKIKSLEKTLPEGMKIGINFDSTKFIEESVHELNFTLIISAILTGLVCWMFLGSWSSTFNVLLSMPTSIVGTFIVLYFCGFTLNTFTLLGLSLAIGIVVDDAIMVLENILRHREKGKGRVESALIGSKEITFAAIAATLSIVAIFLPVVFMQGIIGKFFFQFGITMTVAVVLSLLEALTLTPMRCAQFVEVGERQTRLGRGIEHLIGRISHLYESSLRKSLAHRGKVLVASLLFFVFSLFIFQFINKEFVPMQDQSVFILRVQTPIGSSLDYTDEKFREIEKFLAGRPEINRFFISVGGMGGSDVNTGMSFVTLKDKGSRGISPEINREATQQDFMNICREKLNKITDVKVRIQDLSMRGFTASRGFPIEFVIKGPDWKTLGKLSETMMAELDKSGLMSDLDTNYLQGMPEIQVVPNRDAAGSRGVSVTAIGQTINAMIGGVLVGKFPSGGHRNDIRLKLLDEGQDRLEKITQLKVRNNRGEILPLSQVVKLQEGPSPLSIARIDRERAISIYANVAKGKSQQAAMEMVQTIGKKVLPDGYSMQFTGGSQSMKESSSSLLFALMLGLIVAYMILASQFNSYVDPITVLLALPFSISGAFIALFLSSQSLNIYSMIGLILLMGIVKKNSILLVDFANQVIDENRKYTAIEALMVACPIRLRPILMTSIATIVGALPPALAIGPGAESRIPMAIAVIGGVIVSTFLTLYVVPCAYTYVHSWKKHPEPEFDREMPIPA